MGVMGILIVLFCGQMILAEMKIINYDREELGIELLLTNQTACFEEITTVFHIQRTNYSSNNENLELTYLHETEHIGKRISQEEIQKSFKKYTKANTGTFYANKTGEYRNIFTPLNENISLFWDVNITCEISETNETNISTNITNPLNESVHENINQTINETINQTEDNETNETPKPSEENNTNKESCPLLIKVYTDKITYAVGDQVQINFYVEPFNENTSITYAIKDLSGKFLKTPYTTKNLQTKKYTFSSSTLPEQGFFVHAEAQNNCNTTNDKKLIMLVGEGGENEEFETEIKITKAEYYKSTKKEEIQLNVEIKKGETTKTVITINFKDQKGTKVYETQKIKVLEKQNRIEINMILPFNRLTSTELIKIEIEGLGESITEIIQLPELPEEENKTEEENELEKTNQEKKKTIEIMNTYNRNTYVSEIFSWYVRVKAEGPLNITIQTETNTWEKEVDIRGEETIQFDLENISAKEKITTIIQAGDENQSTVKQLDLKERETAKTHNFTETKEVNNLLTAKTTSVESTSKKSSTQSQIILGGVVIALLVGVFFGYGPRKVFDRFIKKERYNDDEQGENHGKNKHKETN